MNQSTVYKIEMALILIALIASGISVYYLGPSIIGFIIKEFNYEENLNLVVTANGNYTWQPENIGELKSVKLDGKMTNYGRARVYIVSNEIKYLVFDSTRLNEKNATASNETSLITGFAVKENANATDQNKQNKNKKPVWNGNSEFIINGTAAINLSQYFTDLDGDSLIYSVSQAEGLDVSIDSELVTITPTVEYNVNTTITFIASDGIDSKIHIADLIVLATVISIFNETNQSLNITLPINQTNLTNETIDQTQIINETINQTQALNETNQTLNITLPINEANETTNITKSISISLAYNSGTVYDANDNGEESVNGVVDLTVEDTGFSWDADKSRLCARWEVYSIDDDKLTTFCNGNDGCCEFLGLLPSSSNWSDVYYSAFNKDGAGHNNIVSSQVVYYDVNLSIDNPKSEIYSSEWGNLSVKFFEDEAEFSNICIDTCDLTGLNRSSYLLLFEIEDDAVLRINKVKYNVLIDAINSVPILLQNFSAINVPKNKNISINLPDYFSDPDGDVLTYGYYRADNITIFFDNDVATIVPDKEIEGIRLTYITANDSENVAVSNIFMLNISEKKTELTEINFFEIRGNFDRKLAVFDSLGNLNIKGNLTRNMQPIADENDFVIQGSSGALSAVIANPEGNMLIKGSLNEKQSTVNPTPNSFIIQNKNDEYVAYVNSTGDLFLRGILVENVLFD
ncbi:hypothetical protein HYX05_00405 [Candidatus Woesearchaeota archaeon]|nr:hypothetical protein [Candidatus Woesearchaeota archaeon]